MQYIRYIFKEDIGKIIQWLEKWIVMRLNSSVLRMPRDALARADCQLYTRSEEDIVENGVLIPSFHYSYWATASVVIKVEKWVGK